MDNEYYDCGVIEDATHYFLQFSVYDPLRSDITKVIPFECFNINTILYGSLRFSLCKPLHVRNTISVN